VDDSHLKELLETLYASRSRRHLANDPLSLCHRFTDPADREVAGLIAASFAYGNVKIILATLERIFAVIGPSPRRFVESFDPAAGLHRFAGLKHRFNDHRDLCALLLAIRTILDRSGTVEWFFRSGDTASAADITPGLTAFVSAILSFDYSPVFGTPVPPQDSYFPFFFPSPASGSACKRLCMYLRWMVRPADGIDLGIWQSVSPARLVIPVDAHIQRMGRLLGFTSRRQADWRMALEITAALRRLDPADPVKYDFPLCHLGISEGCDGSADSRCRDCAIAGICPRGGTVTNI
jgi:uncharacterized protein (TIGR02757 family)